MWACWKSLCCRRTLLPASGGHRYTLDKCLSVRPSVGWCGNSLCHCSAPVLRHQFPGSTVRMGCSSSKLKGTPEIKTRILIHMPCLQYVKCSLIYMAICTCLCACVLPVSLECFGVSSLQSSELTLRWARKEWHSLLFLYCSTKGVYKNENIILLSEVSRMLADTFCQVDFYGILHIKKQGQTPFVHLRSLSLAL